MNSSVVFIHRMLPFVVGALPSSHIPPLHILFPENGKCTFEACMLRNELKFYKV